MRKKKFNIINIIFYVVLGLVIIISIFLYFSKSLSMSELTYNILYEILKALIISGVIGIISKIVSEEMIKVKRNDDKMRRLGIYSIGEGRLDKKQTNIMFGCKSYHYPTELKFCFISGPSFMKTFKDNIINAIKHGTYVKLMIADPIKSKEYLERADAFVPQTGKDGSYIDQINFTIILVKEIKAEIIKNEYPGDIEVRHYHDEYRYNFRLAKYYIDENEIIRAWVNFQPPNKDAIDQSLTVLGKYDEEYLKESTSRVDKESQSIVLSLDESFDILWNKYKA